MFIHFCSFHAYNSLHFLTLIFNEIYIKFLKGGDVCRAVPATVSLGCTASSPSAFLPAQRPRFQVGPAGLPHLRLFGRKPRPCFLHPWAGPRETDTAPFPPPGSFSSARRFRPFGRQAAPAAHFPVPKRLQHYKRRHIHAQYESHLSNSVVHRHALRLYRLRRKGSNRVCHRLCRTPDRRFRLGWAGRPGRCPALCGAGQRRRRH